MRAQPLSAHAGAPPAAAVSAGALVFVRESGGRKEEIREMKRKSDSFHWGWRAQLRRTKPFFPRAALPSFGEAATFVVSKGRGSGGGLWWGLGASSGFKRSDVQLIYRQTCLTDSSVSGHEILSGCLGLGRNERRFSRHTSEDAVRGPRLFLRGQEP